MSPTSRRILISAGDPSGDLILAKVIEHLRALAGSTPLEFVGLCGPACEAQGAQVLARSHEVAVVGILEVVKKLRTIFGVLHRLERELGRVDSVLCVDFPDFNLKLAEMARKKNVPVDYIVAPQVWAWREQRLAQLRQRLRRLYPALPFEQEILREAGIDARFYGHPFRDLLPPRAKNRARSELGLGHGDFALCLMPGSRRSEIHRHLPLLLDAWEEMKRPALFERLPQALRARRFRLLLPLAPGWTEARFLEELAPAGQAKIAALKTQNLLQFVTDSRQALMAADFGWITSGTATLEAAYYQLPHILVYRLSRGSAFLIQQMSSYFRDPEASAGLANILLGRKVVPELLQQHLSARRLAVESVELLGDASRLANLRRDLRWIPQKMGEAGATERIARDLAGLWGLGA